MTQLSNSMRALITPEMVNKASALLEEKQTNVSNAISTIIPSFLGVLLKKEHAPHIKNILDEAGKLNITSDIKPIFEGKPTKNQQDIGDNFLQHLLGNRAADFTAPVASHADISKVAANRLISMVAPVVAGYLGNKAIKENLTMPQLVEEIGGEKVNFEGLIPIDLIKSFDLYPKLKTGDTTEEAAATNQAKTTADNDRPGSMEKTKKGNEWIIWIVLLLILLALFLWWKSCKGDRDQIYTQQDTDTVIQPEIADSTKIMTQLILPDGVKLNAYPGGVEDKMIQFLQSDEYKNATNETLKNKWFNFDNIDFVFGSATELESGSKAQLDNIIAILKSFKNAKVKIAGFSDVVGGTAENQKLSQDRAKTIESLLDKGGVGSQVVKIQGYGKEFAVHSASESNTERSKDRDIALRFIK